MQTIKTEYKSNAKGEGRITAKGCGIQRTVGYDHAVSAATNHGRAAAEVGNLAGWKSNDVLFHEHTDNGKHTFKRV